MLIHISPRFFIGNYDIPVQLVDVTVDPLGLVLRDGLDVVMRQPFPNKRIYVACRKVGRKAMDGLLIDTGAVRIKEFDVVTRWAVFAGDVVTHRVKHLVLDGEFDAVSTDMTLWHATCESLGGWESRMPALPENASPASHMPCMALIAEHRVLRTGDVVDELNTARMIKERREVFSMPTIQPERLHNRRVEERLPQLKDAFIVLRDEPGQRAAA